MYIFVHIYVYILRILSVGRIGLPEGAKSACGTFQQCVAIIVRIELHILLQ